MGRDKGALRVAGATLVERAAAKLAGIGLEVVLADRGASGLSSFASVADGPGHGPGAGILGAAQAHPHRALLVLACDLPNLPAALLEALAGSRGYDWAVPRWERGIEPLCALYRPAAIAALAASVADGPAPHRLAGLPGLRVQFLEAPLLERFGAPAEMFLNLNTPADLARWRAAPRPR